MCRCGGRCPVPRGFCGLCCSVGWGVSALLHTWMTVKVFGLDECELFCPHPLKLLPHTNLYPKPQPVTSQDKPSDTGVQIFSARGRTEFLGGALGPMLQSVLDGSGPKYVSSQCHQPFPSPQTLPCMGQCPGRTSASPRGSQIPLICLCIPPSCCENSWRSFKVLQSGPP